MKTQTLSLKYPQKVGSGSNLAILFFFLGAPHIYSFLNRRSHQKAAHNKQLFNLKAIGVLVSSMLGTVALFAF